MVGTFLAVGVGGRIDDVEHSVRKIHLSIRALVSLNQVAACVYSPAFSRILEDADGARIARVIVAMGEHVVERAQARCEDLDARMANASVRFGNYAEEILAAAQECDPDLIVIVTRGVGNVRGAILGSVAQKVLHHAHCNVMTVASRAGDPRYDAIWQ